MFKLALNRTASRFLDLLMVSFLFAIVTEDVKLTMFGTIIIFYLQSSTLSILSALSNPITISIKGVTPIEKTNP